MNYTSREVVRRLKQYDMFLNSLELINDELQRERIYDQLDKIEKQILLETNNEYEEEYMLLVGEETKLFSEEKAKLKKLIALVESRKKYLEERKVNHKKITGSLVELTTFLGEDKLIDFKNRLRIIEKYEDNKTKSEKIIKELKHLDIKISEASRNVKANMRLNDSLENKMIEKVEKSLNTLKLYSLTDEKNEILKKHNTLKYALDMAKENLKSARTTGNATLILECDGMLSEIMLEYSKYNENLNIIKLIDIYDNPVSSYDELLSKREKIEDILKNITESTLYREINEELSKQYNTIKLEKNDIEVFESLKRERESKNKLLYEMDEENNSKEFKLVIGELIKNEERIKEEKIRIAKRNEYNERQKRLEEEQKIEASRVRRQKLIEEIRLKDQLETTERLKKLQNETVINEKEEDKEIKSFDKLVLNDNFNSNELFDKTKIMPNKKEISSEEKIIKEEPELKEENISVNNQKVEEIPLWEAPNSGDDEKLEELFKEKEKIEDLSITSAGDNIVSEDSIYDLLENSDNIMWNTTNSEPVNNTIPIIGNNNLKPEILGSSKVEDISFPNMDKKEGEVLWKETM